MAGHLQTHPFFKTYDETRRSINRLERYLDSHFMELSDETKVRINIMMEGLQKTLDCIPEVHYYAKRGERN